MTAYQEDFLSLDDLRLRMPELRKREQTVHAELNAIESQLVERAGYLRLADTVTNFLEDDEVISIGDDLRTKSFPTSREPPVFQKAIQMHVGEQRTYYSPNAKDNLGRRQAVGHLRALRRARRRSASRSA